ncbi:MAG: radical SAM protein [Deltaproteobacteria bacterium]|nr:radical SAM protein [Deltaproteobacteria bacterium]
MIRNAHYLDESKREAWTRYLLGEIREKRLVSLYVEPASACNLACRFCDFHFRAHEVGFAKRKRLMSMSMFENVVQQVRELPFRFSSIHFYLHGEPLLHPRLAEMISMARRLNLADFYKILTNGTLLDPSRFVLLVESGATSITVSLDTMDGERYSKFKGKDLLPLVMQNIAYAIHATKNHKDFELIIKCTRSHDIYGLQQDEVEEIVSYFSDAAAESSNIHVEIRDEFSWAGSDRQDVAPRTRPCELPFYQLVISCEGVVSACCNDINYGLEIGRLSPGGDTLNSIAHGERLQRLRRLVLARDFDSLAICKYCSFTGISDLFDHTCEIADLI